jgi:vacuolar protein sorting-associated protein 1
MTDNDIDTAVRMYEGDSLPGFPSPDTFEYLVLPHLKTIQEPVMDCLGNIVYHI